MSLSFGSAMPHSPGGHRIEALDGDPVQIWAHGVRIETVGQKMIAAATTLDRVANDDGRGESMDALREDIHDRRIVTPISGTVTIPDDLAPGDFVMPGAPIAFVVPTDTELVARVRVPATEISRVEVGQTAEVKVDALDFTRYGRITGTVRTLSPSALVSEQGQVYYMAEVGLDSDRLSDGIVTHELRPGMGVQAELINGSRTILAYLFKPVEQALDSAFKEE